MISVTQAFLNVYWDRKSPVLLGYSGGPDSKALLYALLECGISPHLAHVDHGWRESSRDEAEELRKEAEKLGLVFYTTRLTAVTGNKEDEARKGRLSFFRKLIPPYQALLLAHQADDLAETVLKRVLEGAHLSNLGGMEPVSQHSGMTIWRPLLKVRRAEILTFLEERSLNPMIDPTNSDPIYLRSRMRLKILPMLKEMFGKEITENLILLSERALELRAFLDQRAERGDLKNLEPIELRYALQKKAREHSIVLTRSSLETLLNWVRQKATRHLIIQGKKIFVERGNVFFLKPRDSTSVL